MHPGVSRVVRLAKKGSIQAVTHDARRTTHDAHSPESTPKHLLDAPMLILTFILVLFPPILNDWGTICPMTRRHLYPRNPKADEGPRPRRTDGALAAGGVLTVGTW